MVVLGLVLIAVGGVLIVSAVFTAEHDASGNLQLLGVDIGPLALFLVGVGAGLAICFGWAFVKGGTRRGLERRRERKRLAELSEKLDEVEAERRHDVDKHEDQDRPTL
jgi:hypothetical protein